MKIAVVAASALAVVGCSLEASHPSPAFTDVPVAHGSADGATDHWLAVPDAAADGELCGTPPPAPGLAASIDAGDCSPNLTVVDPAYAPDGHLVEIPVVFHVIENAAGDGAVSDEIVLSQLDVLNEEFQALFGTQAEQGRDASIRFALARMTPEGDATPGIVRYVDDLAYADDFDAKYALHWNTRRYFNFYINGLERYAGYSYVPPDSAGKPHDGVVMAWAYVGRDAPGARPDYAMGRVAVHEVGHYLGLYHTFQGGCAAGDPYATGDLIADTPAQESPGSCINPVSTCGTPDPVHNHMNYAPDSCRDEFTDEQINRMRCALFNHRPDLYNIVPIADFDLEDLGDHTFAFTDLSFDVDGAIASHAWDFGDGTTSDQPSPTHVFDEPGGYTVTLEVIDDRGSSRTLSREVRLNRAPTAQFSWSATGLSVSFTDLSDDDLDIASHRWDFGDGEASQADAPTHAFAQPGTYDVSLTVEDADGLESTQSQLVEVANAPPPTSDTTVDHPVVVETYSSDPSAPDTTTGEPDTTGQPDATGDDAPTGGGCSIAAHSPPQIPLFLLTALLLGRHRRRRQS